MITWHDLSEESQLNDLIQASYLRPQLIFKHSFRCGTSAMIEHRLHQLSDDLGWDWYQLDLIRYRSLSNAIASRFKVWHESPQVLVIDQGACTAHTSHSAITSGWLEEQVSKLQKQGEV
jgi:bacillithiol system protein YtxJ